MFFLYELINSPLVRVTTHSCRHGTIRSGQCSIAVVRASFECVEGGHHYIPGSYSNERKGESSLLHADGDFHTMVNVWNAAEWTYHQTKHWDPKDEAQHRQLIKVWGKLNMTRRSFMMLKDCYDLVTERCCKLSGTVTGRVFGPPKTDKMSATRPSLAIFKSHKSSLMVGSLQATTLQQLNQMNGWLALLLLANEWWALKDSVSFQFCIQHRTIRGWYHGFDDGAIPCKPDISMSFVYIHVSDPE